MSTVLLGSGGYGSVFKCQNLSNHRECAVKIADKTKEENLS